MTADLEASHLTRIVLAALERGDLAIAREAAEALQAYVESIAAAEGNRGPVVDLAAARGRRRGRKRS